MTDKSLQVQEKKEVQSRAESTRTVPVYVPAVDIYESADGVTLLVDMPGATEETVAIDLDNDELTIRGTVPEENTTETLLLQEYRTGDYYRKFEISHVIDREKIEANINNGVLKVVLPKAEIAKPRKIEIKTT